MPSLRGGKQLGRSFPDVTKKLHSLYTSLRAHFGYQPLWWPGTPWEIALSALLVQQCDWTVAHRGLQYLIEAGIGGIRELARASSDDVQDCIRSISFAPTKAGRLIAFAGHLDAKGFASIEQYLASAATGELRNDLLSLRGVGHETADAILLFAGTSHATFVIDAYTRRILSRVKLDASLDEGYWKRRSPELRQFLQEHLLADLSLYDDFEWYPDVPREVALLRDYHALLVELGRHHCLKSRPRCHVTGKHGWTDYEFCRRHCLATVCEACPLSDSCASAGDKA